MKIIRPFVKTNKQEENLAVLWLRAIPEPVNKFNFKLTGKNLKYLSKSIK